MFEARVVWRYDFFRSAASFSLFAVRPCICTYFLETPCWVLLPVRYCMKHLGRAIVEQ